MTYNTSTKWPMTIGYWGACQNGGCGGGGKQNVYRSFDDIDPVWDVVILSFIEFQPGGTGAGLCLNLSSHDDVYKQASPCDDANTPTGNDIPGLKESIQKRQNSEGFVLASIGGENGSLGVRLGYLSVSF